MNIKFLGAVIAYSGTDSAAQLAKSGSGIRFLALASALLCFPSHEAAAKALDLMMKSSAGNGQILPTVGQLEDLLQSLEPKLTRVSFGSLIMSWTDRLSRWCQERGLNLEQSYECDTCPTEKELQALIDTFRHARRLGEVQQENEQPKYVTITTHVCFPWLIAFIEWCNGSPPSIIIGNDYVPMKDPDPLITVKIWPKTDPFAPLTEADIKVETFSSLDRLSTLWEEYVETPCRGHWKGLIPVEDHGKRWIRALEFEGDIQEKVVHEALSVSVSLVSAKLQQNIATAETSGQSFSLLPPKRRIADSLGLFLGTSPPRKLMNTEKLMSVFDALLVRGAVDAIRGSCPCADCSGNIAQLDGYCKLVMLQRNLASMTADIVTIAQFEVTEPIRLLFRPDRYNVWRPHLRDKLKDFERMVHGTIFPVFSLPKVPAHEREDSIPNNRSYRGPVWRNDVLKKPDNCDVYQIIRNSLDLIGHDKVGSLNKPGDQWIASSYRGQVVFPATFEYPVLDGAI